ncbi:uncharacterized protein HD556DRAFT_1440680 [Suillus plorans]|uniref:Uncharacterized protein n=1 Tax=Suillus plorans TaxID=116603 RepID=A0A9P7DLE3_9AGAM|nr:uncharacterized protein HD556DRAFT_1440680 [Suillus plorans]KAG1797721.1 hypothetical protein HD556DRAFT_1440680 [Suillus plorans]
MLFTLISAYRIHQPTLPTPSQHHRTKVSIETSEDLSKSSLSEDDTINCPHLSNLLFPPLPPKNAFTLKPARFNPETPTLPLTRAEPTLSAPASPPIPQPEFLKPPLLPPKTPKHSTNFPTIPLVQIATPNPSITMTTICLAPAQPLYVPPLHTTRTTTSSSFPTMSNKGIGAMPGPGSSKAPSFNGETSELLKFLELFEDLASSYALTDTDKCKMIV